MKQKEEKRRSKRSKHLSTVIIYDVSLCRYLYLCAIQLVFLCTKNVGRNVTGIVLLVNSAGCKIGCLLQLSRCVVCINPLKGSGIT